MYTLRYVLRISISDPLDPALQIRRTRSVGSRPARNITMGLYNRGVQGLTSTIDSPSWSGRCRSQATIGTLIPGLPKCGQRWI